MHRITIQALFYRNVTSILCRAEDWTIGDRHLQILCRLEKKNKKKTLNKNPLGSTSLHLKGFWTNVACQSAHQVFTLYSNYHIQGSWLSGCIHVSCCMDEPASLELGWHFHYYIAPLSLTPHSSLTLWTHWSTGDYTQVKGPEHWAQLGSYC